MRKIRIVVLIGVDEKMPDDTMSEYVENVVRSMTVDIVELLEWHFEEGEF